MTIATSPSLRETVSASRQAIKVGSLSFSLAASLLGRASRQAIFMLYAWCRHCDDRIDELTARVTLSDKLAVHGRLVAATSAGIKAPDDSEQVFFGFGHVVRTHDIPEYYPLQLLEGMRMDIEGHRYETFEDLLTYCYRVAGVVGLMATHVLGASSSAAVTKAVHMGMAMQLTNIARDVFDDYAMGRVYLPATLLRRHGVDARRLREPAMRCGLVLAVTDMLRVAEDLYRSGDSGLRYLPLRAAFAVAAARCIYAEIGRKVQKRGSTAWNERTYVPLPRKLLLLGRAAFMTMATVPSRLRRFVAADLPTLTAEEAVASARAMSRSLQDPH